MTAPTFSYPAHQGSGGLTVNPRIFQAELGDGYEQRTQAGLVASDVRYKYQAKNANNTDVEAMIAFFDALGPGVRPFYWTIVGEISPRLWVQDGDYRKLNEKGSSSDFQITFKQWHGAEE
jgi:phage-related protein